MKKILTAALIAAIPALMSAQSAIDAYNLSQGDLRGTARFMSMGGAFTALGGDLSVLGQNPAGIGLYRSSEVGITLDVDFASANTYDGVKTNATKAMVPNLGYIGSISLGSEVMPYFQWGISYGRIANLNRTLHGNINGLQVSLSDFAAYSANGTSPDVLGYERKMDDGVQSPANPYKTDADWLSILAFNSYTINALGSDSYRGLFQDTSSGYATYDIRQRGYVDEYNIDFGGNIMNTVYWGLGFGITDLSLNSETYYNETIFDADVAKKQGMGSAVVPGDAYNSLGNMMSVSGTGFNFKIGAIIKPINALRFGFSIQTPTYYNLNMTRSGDMYYEYYLPDAKQPFNKGTSYTDNSYFDWKLRSPWKLNVGIAGVIGGRFIISTDYELAAFKNMRVEDGYGNEDTYVTGDIQSYFKPQSTIRVGAEYRVTPQFSLRAGFGYAMSAVQKGVNEGDVDVFTNGQYLDNPNPAYTFDTSTRYITCGLGYRFGGFYIDAAYVNKYRQSTYHPFSSFGDFLAPDAQYAISENNLVLSLGYKF